MNDDPIQDANDDIELQSVQDDLDTQRPDPIMNELGDDPTEELGINPSEFRDGLNDIDTDATGGSDDWREEIEDRDQDGDNRNET